MAHYAVRESPPLRGEIPISTSKNAVLPIMCGALLTGEDVRIERVPELTDVKTLCALLASCGCSVKKEGDALVLNAGALQNPQDEEDVRKMRASVLVLGPLLSRLGEARIPLPGGCAIGQRPIDQHLKGMSALGAKVKFDHGGVTLSGRLRGAVIYLDMPSVGATENLLMAATLASGTTRIENAAKEPEIVDLAAFLNAMGARIAARAHPPSSSRAFGRCTPSVGSPSATASGGHDGLRLRHHRGRAAAFRRAGGAPALAALQAQRSGHTYQGYAGRADGLRPRQAAL